MSPESALKRLGDELSLPPLNRWLAVEPVSVDGSERVCVRLPFRRELSYHDELEVFHGGIVASLADIAGYAAVAIGQDGACPTMSLAIDYLKPAMGPSLDAVAILRRRGRTVSRVDIEILSGKELVAIARGTFHTGGAA